MGVDVTISIKPKTITRDGIKALNQEIYHRFKNDISSEYPESWELQWTDEDQAYTMRSFMRYYGEGYERGPFPTIFALVMFIKDAIPDGDDVFYYGDYSELEDASPTTYAELRELFAHWVKNGHKPYLGLEADHPCPSCNNHMWKSGWNGEKEMYSCTMCEYTDWKDR